MNTTKEIIDDLKEGKMVIIVDDEDRENKGDLVCAADEVNSDIVNFMAKHEKINLTNYGKEWKQDWNNYWKT